MAIFKPPQGTTAEREAIVLENGELMFDTTKNAFYTGNNFPGGQVITNASIRIASIERVPNNEPPAFEDTPESTPENRAYKFKFPNPDTAFSAPVTLAGESEVRLPEDGKVSPFLRVNERNDIELAVKRPDGTVEMVAADSSGTIRLCVCQSIDTASGTVSAHPIQINADGSASLVGETETLFYTWNVTE